MKRKVKSSRKFVFPDVVLKEQMDKVRVRVKKECKDSGLTNNEIDKVITSLIDSRIKKGELVII